LSKDELHVAGRVELAATPKFHLLLHTSLLSFSALADSGVNTPVSEGTFQTAVSITGEGTNWKLWSTSGSATIHGGVVPLPGLNQELTDLSGRFRVTPRGVMLDGISFTTRDGDVRLTGIVEDWRNHPRARVMVESSHLNLSSFLARKTSTPNAGGNHVQDWIQSKEAAITFLVKQLHYERLVLQTVSGEIKINNQRIKLNELRGRTPKGMLSGRLEARFAGNEQMDLAADVNADGIPAQQVLPATQEIEHLQGDLSIDGVLLARVGPNSSLKNTLTTGRDGIRVKIKNGSLHQDPVLTRALKFLNLPAVLFGEVDFDQGGIPFDVLSARVTAQDGVFFSEDIILDSPVIKVAGAGSADVNDNGLDLAVAVSPVASYSDLFAKVPLLGPLLVGDHSGLTTAVFQVKGPLQNPDVAYLPLRSIAQGLTGYPRLALDVLSHAIKLPPTALAFLAE
jgi:AsmA-like C-terminal region